MVWQAWASKVRAGKGSKGDRLGLVDHATISYAPFRKNFYIEVLLLHAHAAPSDSQELTPCLPPAVMQAATKLYRTCLLVMSHSSTRKHMCMS